jgi:hypothetical protein
VRRLLTILVLVCLSQNVSADERWVTFKSNRNDWGLIQHQIDRRTIRLEGPSRWTFWTRMWRTEKKEPLVASYYGSLIFWSQKFAVDCVGRKFGPSFIDSNLPSERKRSATPVTMRWRELGKYPAVAKTICGA